MRLTAEAETRLREELRSLVEEEAPRVRRMVEESKSAGDNSQNPDYFLASEEEANVMGRIKRIMEALERHAEAGEVTDTSVVQAGVYVDLDFGDGPETFYVGAIEAAGGDIPVITLESRVGSAIAGRGIGEDAGGARILAIRTEP